jgi:hypothetical protein
MVLCVDLLMETSKDGDVMVWELLCMCGIGLASYAYAAVQRLASIFLKWQVQRRPVPHSSSILYALQVCTLRNEGSVLPVAEKDMYEVGMQSTGCNVLVE